MDDLAAWRLEIAEIIDDVETVECPMVRPCFRLPRSNYSDVARYGIIRAIGGDRRLLAKCVPSS